MNYKSQAFLSRYKILLKFPVDIQKRTGAAKEFINLCQYPKSAF